MVLKKRQVPSNASYVECWHSHDGFRCVDDGSNGERMWIDEPGS